MKHKRFYYTGLEIATHWSPSGDSRFVRTKLKNASYKQESSFFLSSQMKITKRLIILKKFSRKTATKTLRFVREQFLTYRHSKCLSVMAWILVLSVFPVSSSPECNSAWLLSLERFMAVFQAKCDGKTVWNEEILVN